ncbi:MAG: hypothetical protein CM15mP74_37340 [Halieaceae bacterium]|nr:MAG: hypothetical protein CM15mP74_37340 [Halieaceae bacterium]
MRACQQTSSGKLSELWWASTQTLFSTWPPKQAYRLGNGFHFKAKQESGFNEALARESVGEFPPAALYCSNTGEHVEE